MKHNWEYKKFSQLVNSITPITKIDKSNYLKSGSFPIVSQEESYISGYWNNPQDITPHAKAVVIFGDHSRVLKYIDFDFVVGADGVKILEPKDGYDTKFLFHYLRWYNVPSLGYSRHFKLIKEAKYPVPPMEVQEQIVTELDKLNEIIATRKEQLKELDNLAQSLFYDTFGDPVSNPKGWMKRELGKVCDVRDGTHDSPEYIEFGIPLVTSKNIVNGKIDFSSANAISIEDAKAINKRSKVDFGDILMPMIGTIGNPIIVKNDNVFCIKNIALIKKRENNIDFTFILNFLKSKAFEEYINKNKKGATQKFLSINLIRNLLVPIPPLHLQQQFASQVEAIEKQKEMIEASIAELQTLLDSRMDYWFN